ncbi:MAG TPA: hypothetical protein VGC21_15855 [Telluria sp.]
MQEAAAICWPHQATVGHITVSTPLVYGQFPHSSGPDARLRCALVAAGKFRNGAARAWCRSHQHYWGTKADLASALATGERSCARAEAPVGYLLAPPLVDLRHSALPASSPALAIAYDRSTRLFSSEDIVQVNLTPPAVSALLAAKQAGRALGCVECRRCAHPHLDLGAFAERPHRRHTCGNCGHDATHSGEEIVSNPLFALLRFYGKPMEDALSTVQRFLVL